MIPFLMDSLSDLSQTPEILLLLVYFLDSFGMIKKIARLNSTVSKYL